MAFELAKGLKDIGTYEMLKQLKGMLQKQARQECFDIMKQLISCRMEQGSSDSAYVIKMKGCIDRLKKLDYPLPDETASDFILNSLPSSYDQFVMNFNMNAWVKTVSELHGMLKTAEMSIPNKTNQVLVVRSSGVKKLNHKNRGYNGKGKKNVTVAANHANSTNKNVVKVPLPPPEERQ
ncbi:uncharacterized protein LOC143532857 [Bidens hawaiensis]|uniref:uncharacterized protein LOC143532857 n=1 Tax=Bidens hawaiensis TaxID=980011 RepID=UPI00404A1E79